MDGPPGQRLPVAAAASVLGVSEKTIRRRIKAGTIAAERVVTPQGHVWLVDVGPIRPDTQGQAVQVTAEGRQAAIAELTRTVAEQVTRSLSIRIEELTRENEQLRARLQALEPPKAVEGDVRPIGHASNDQTPEPAARPWWRRAWEWVRV